MTFLTSDVGTWRALAEDLETGEFQFFTGRQQRQAIDLAAFISDATSYAPNETDNVTIGFDGDWDGTLIACLTENL